MLYPFEYKQALQQGDIPKYPPHGASPFGWDYDMTHYMDAMKLRSWCNERGLWTVIDQVWTRALAQWAGDRTVLEIMAGAGWLAKALTENGVHVVATDDFSWGYRHRQMELVHEVQRFDATEAARQFPADILLVSWPPYGDEQIIKACNAWGPDRPIVYIGEGEGGCNAPDPFWARFYEPDDAPAIPLMSWPGLHDQVIVGTWREPESEDENDNDTHGRG